MEKFYKIEDFVLFKTYVQPSEISIMPYYRFEIMVENLEEWNNKQNEQQKSEEDDFNIGDYTKNMQGSFNKQLNGLGGNPFAKDFRIK